jgi:hypothetical protein
VSLILYTFTIRRTDFEYGTPDSCELLFYFKILNILSVFYLYLIGGAV